MSRSASSSPSAQEISTLLLSRGTGTSPEPQLWPHQTLSRFLPKFGHGWRKRGCLEARSTPRHPPSQRSPASTPALSSPSLTALNAHSFLQDSIVPLQPQGSGHVHRFLFETEQQAHPALFITLTQVLEEFICRKKYNNYINKHRPLAKLLLLPSAAEGPGELKAHHRQHALLGREEGT